MSRTINRPATNITAPTAPHPAAAHLGVKFARAVTRHERTLLDMLAGPVLARRVDVRDRYTFAAADLTTQDGLWLSLTDTGRQFAAQLTIDQPEGTPGTLTLADVPDLETQLRRGIGEGDECVALFAEVAKLGLTRCVTCINGCDHGTDGDAVRDSCGCWGAVPTNDCAGVGYAKAYYGSAR